MKRLVLLVLLLIVLILPTYWGMLRFGIYSMHDFHLFRLYEFNKCIVDLQIPCRWSPDSAFAYGQPMFNFYGQFPYVIGEIFHFLGFSIIDSTKGAFIFSLVASALTMFLLACQLWKNNYAAMLSALIYVYAPYRAVDVWVRGALPEALAFVWFPLITFFFNRYVEERKGRDLLWFAASFAGLILTHNLSAVMYTFFLIPWGLYMLYIHHAWKLIPKFVITGLLTLGLVAFYVLPVAVESQYITLGKTTEGYYDYRIHYVTLNQLLLSRNWGFGASVWGEDDGLSLSVGQIQWIIPFLVLACVLVTRAWKKYDKFIILFFLGWGMLLLTHNKSTPLWNALSPLAYVQFPWRFLGSAVFLFALASGALLIFIRKPVLQLITVMVVLAALISLNAQFFYEDLWFAESDTQQFSGERFEFHASSAVNDYWPTTAPKTPIALAPINPLILEGSGSGQLITKDSDSAQYQVEIKSPQAEVSLPIVYFPGWQAQLNQQSVAIYPKGEQGLMTLPLSQGSHHIDLQFTNTPIRTLGNAITALSLAVFAGLLLKLRK